MKFTSWPDPPMHTSKEPPEIPERFKSFGLDYRLEGGNAYLDMPRKPLDKKSLEESIEASFQQFLLAIKTLDGTFLDNIRDIHTNINEEINMAIACEKEDIIKQGEDVKTRMKNDVLQKMDQIINKK
ncbi:hypothetical protein GINT2_001251 [Glugoides intestinalis]